MRNQGAAITGLCITHLCCAAATARGGADDQLCLSLVADGLDSPVYATAPPGDVDRMFIVEQYDDDATGRVRIVRNGTLLPAAFLEVGPVSVSYATGLLCIAFAPDYAASGHVYVFYTDAAGTVVISRFAVSSEPDVADADSELVILTIPQPHEFHQGGWLGFGQDGYLYVSSGDGGPADDPDQRGQDISSLLGKILRLDVSADAFPADPLRNYAIPPDNPFIGNAPRDEIWALGVREVWRSSFDRLTGDFYLADVGQESREEINVEPGGFDGGANYGWRCREGEAVFANDPECGAAVLTSPVYEYDHADGRCCVIGGYVYRGSELPALAGRYFFADHCTAEIQSFRCAGGAISEFTTHSVVMADGGAPLEMITTFGEDAAGEHYIAARTGEIYKVIRPTDCAGPCGCVWDVNDSGAVDVGDLLALLAAWGPCPSSSCPTDFNADDHVDVTDLLELLSNWG